LHAALAGKFAHREEVQFAFLAGQRSQSGFLIYYLVALLLKTPLPLLGLAALGAATLVRRRAPRELLLLLVPALAILATFSAMRVDIGVRHVLPVVPALVLLAALGLAALGRRGRAGNVVRALVVVLWAIGVARVHPQYLAYFNVLAGGPAGGSRWLLDSNLAWGQDDARLQRFLADAERRGEEWTVDPDPRVPRTGRLAVDVNTLHDLQRRSDRLHAWLRHFAPTDFAGWSWPLFRLEEEDFERVARARPQEPVAQAAYAEVLMARGAGDAARQCLEAAAARLRGAPFAELARLAAESAARRTDWVEALRWVKRGLAAQPLDADLPGLGRWFELESQLQRADRANEPAAARAGLELGLFRAESGQVRQALPALQRAAAALQDTADARRAYAVALARLGDYAAALALLEMPGMTQWAQERDLCRALAQTQAGLAHDRPGLDVRLLRELGRAGFESERYDEALPAFLEILRQGPDDAEALAFVGEMQVRCKLRLVDARLQPRPVRVRSSSSTSSARTTPMPRWQSSGPSRTRTGPRPRSPDRSTAD
jgi:tetratricopeptide (TPR) repeat protein